MLSRKKGFSLPEILIAIGIVGILGKVVMSITQQMNKATNAVVQKSELNMQTSEFFTFFSSQDACTLNIRDYVSEENSIQIVDDIGEIDDVSGNEIPIPTIFRLKREEGTNVLGRSDQARFTTPFDDKQGKFHLEEMGIVNKFFADVEGETSQRISVTFNFYYKAKMYEVRNGAENKIKFITLVGIYDTSTNKLVSCHSQGNGEDSLWSIVDGYEGIYYDHGPVGIGTSKPIQGSGLHVHNSVNGPAKISMTRYSLENGETPPIGTQLTTIDWGAYYDPNDPTLEGLGVWSIETLVAEEKILGTDTFKGVSNLVIKKDDKTAATFRMRTDSTYADFYSSGNIYSNTIPPSEDGSNSGLVLGFGEYARMVKLARDMGVPDDAVFGVGWCNRIELDEEGNPVGGELSGCNTRSTAGNAFMGVAMPSGAGNVFNIFGIGGDGISGLASSGNVYTNMAISYTMGPYSNNEEPFIVGFGEYGRMIMDAEAWNIPRGNVFGIGWCKRDTSGLIPNDLQCGNRSNDTAYIGVAMPSGVGKIFNIFGIGGDSIAGLGANGNVYTNMAATYALGPNNIAGTPFIVGFGEYGRMLDDAAEWGISDQNVFGIGWCAKDRCGDDGETTSNPKIGVMLPHDSTFHIYGKGTPSIPDGKANLEVDGDLVVDANVTVDGTTHHSSDKNLKKDIKKIKSPLELLEEIVGVKFKWKSNDKKSVGVIAQDVQKVLPELVSKGSDQHLSVDYNGIVALLVESVKEQQKTIESMKKEIHQLNSKLEKAH